MKRILFALILVCCATSIILAQPKRRFSPEEYAKKQQTFITEFAKLLPQEADAFFPLYFEFQQNKWKINKEARKKIKWEKGVEPTETAALTQHIQTSYFNPSSSASSWLSASIS